MTTYWFEWMSILRKVSVKHEAGFILTLKVAATFLAHILAVDGRWWFHQANVCKFGTHPDEQHF